MGAGGVDMVMVLAAAAAGEAETLLASRKARVAGSVRNIVLIWWVGLYG